MRRLDESQFKRGFQGNGLAGTRCIASRRLVALLLAIAALVVGVAPSTHAAQTKSVVTINADGTSTVRTEQSESRMQVETQLRAWLRMKRMSEGAADEELPATGAPGTPSKESKPLLDEELRTKYRELIEERNDGTLGGGEMKLESIEVTSNSVRAVTATSYASLEALLRSPYTWLAGFYFANVRIEKEGASNFRLTLGSPGAMGRWLTSQRQQWKATGMAAELMFVFPGKVVSSGFTNIDGNSTWFGMNASNDASLDAAVKLLQTQVVIVAEAGGLKLDAPLDSSTLSRRASMTARGEPDLPITDAGPGFLAEPTSVTVTSIRYFPEGQKYFKDGMQGFGYGPTGTVVHAKFFAPKGRTLQSVSSVRVLKAVDDKGRSINSTNDESQSANMASYGMGASRDVHWSQIQLHLPLPPPDAQSIEHLEAEAIAITVGSWKSMVVTNVSAGSTNSVDLSEVLPGARLEIAKITSRNRQMTIIGQLQGPAGIRQLELQAKVGTDDNSNSWFNERNFRSKGAKAIRSFTLRYSSAHNDENAPTGALSLVVRLPADPKRERVKFSLNGLDLL